MEPETRETDMQKWQRFLASFGIKPQLVSRTIYFRDPAVVSSAMLSDALRVPINDQAGLEIHFRLEDSKYLGLHLDLDS